MVASGNVEASGSYSIHGIGSYDWKQISGPVVTLQNSGDSVVSHTVPDAGLQDIQLEFQLTVQDSIGRVSHENFIVTVERKMPVPIPIVLLVSMFTAPQARPFTVSNWSPTINPIVA